MPWAQASQRALTFHTFPTKMAATMMLTLLLGVASGAYQGGGDQTYNTEDEHLGHGGPGGNGPAVVDFTSGRARRP